MRAQFVSQLVLEIGFAMEDWAALTQRGQHWANFNHLACSKIPRSKREWTTNALLGSSEVGR